MQEWIRSFGRRAGAAVSALSEAGRTSVLYPVRLALGVADECLTIGAVAGLALLCLAQPTFQVTGPGWLRRLDLAVTFVDRDGVVLGHRGIHHEDRLRLDELPRHLVHAVLATEDRRFYRHWGIDPIGVGRALLANAEADGVVQGGSTITQQLAKNIWLSSERTIERKLSEAFLAVWLEHQLTKDEILKLYLDRAYMGAGTFGIQAAARVYFSKSARDLTLAEAAMLAGLYKAPSRYAPHISPTNARARADIVLDRMVDDGTATIEEARHAKLEPVTLVEREQRWQPHHYLDRAFRETQRLSAQGRLGQSSILVAEVGIDTALQKQAEAEIEQALDGPGRRLHVDQAAFVAMEPMGAIRALVGGRDYGRSQFNRATDALRQPGSAFKPIVYAAALASTGLRPGSMVKDEKICIRGWCPENYSRSFSGSLPLAAALSASLNTVAVRLSAMIGATAGEITLPGQAAYGRRRIIRLAQDLGIASRIHDTPSLPLGASEVTPLELTGAFAAFANGGLRVEPHAVIRVRDGHGSTLWDAASPAALPRRALATQVMGDMNTMLTQVVQAGTARRAALSGQVVAGKTGTASAYRDAWFVGFTSHLVGGLWMGNDDHKPTLKVTGGQLPAATWRSIMASAHRDLPSSPLPGTDGPAGDGGGLLAEIRPARGGGFQEVGGAKGSFTVAR